MKLSVITPTYNRAKFLEDNIQSVKASILKPYENDITIEHIIYDDGSTDDTKEVVDKLMHPSLKYFRREENKGPGDARNTSIKLSSGEFIFPLDDDDVILERSIVNICSEFLDNSDLEWVETDFLKVNQNLEYLIGQDYYGWEFDDTEGMLRSIFDDKHFIQGNVVYSKKIFEEVGGYDSNLSFAEDLDLYVRFLIRGYLPKYLKTISHLHRVHHNNLTKDIDSIKHIKSLEILKEKYKKDLSF
jgi:glycosyltransferase involved in cell wall biosynthesis